MSFMTFEERVRQLCDHVATSGSETEAIELARQLQSLMHERVEEVRGNLLTMPLLGPDSKGVCA
jgi:hypothetical protein